MEPRIQYAKPSDGVSIAYATLGEGRPIVFSPRVFGDIHLYTNVDYRPPYIGPLVERGWRVIFYDGRGTGSSQRDATGGDLNRRILDLEAVVEAVGSDRFALCGVASGGPAAIVYSVQRPERVSHLVLVNTFAHGAEYFESYADGEKAETRIRSLRDAVAGCREPLREWLRRFAEQISDENLTLNIRDFSLEEMPFTSFGEESLALRTTIAVDGVERPTSVTTDLIVLRVDNVLAGLDYTTSDREADRDLEERLMAIIEERARAAAESLK